MPKPKITPHKQLIKATPEAVVERALKGSDSPHVVVGPIVWHDSNPKQKYFIVATSEASRGFRCDRIDVRGKDDRERIMLAFIAKGALVIHNLSDSDEVYMVRLCEMLWPGERISKLRASVEAENASRRVH